MPFPAAQAAARDEDDGSGVENAPEAALVAVAPPPAAAKKRPPRTAARMASTLSSLATCGPAQSLAPALLCTPWNVLARRQSCTHPLRMPSQVHSCLVDALYHLLVQAVNIRICINAARAIMMPGMNESHIGPRLGMQP